MSFTGLPKAMGDALATGNDDEMISDEVHAHVRSFRESEIMEKTNVEAEIVSVGNDILTCDSSDEEFFSDEEGPRFGDCEIQNATGSNLPTNQSISSSEPEFSDSEGPRSHFADCIEDQLDSRATDINLTGTGSPAQIHGFNRSQEETKSGDMAQGKTDDAVLSENSRSGSDISPCSLVSTPDIEDDIQELCWDLIYLVSRRLDRETASTNPRLSSKRKNMDNTSPTKGELKNQKKPRTNKSGDPAPEEALKNPRETINVAPEHHPHTPSVASEVFSCPTTIPETSAEGKLLPEAATDDTYIMNDLHIASGAQKIISKVLGQKMHHCCLNNTRWPASNLSKCFGAQLLLTELPFAHFFLAVKFGSQIHVYEPTSESLPQPQHKKVVKDVFGEQFAENLYLIRGNIATGSVSSALACLYGFVVATSGFCPVLPETVLNDIPSYVIHCIKANKIIATDVPLCAGDFPEFFDESEIRRSQITTFRAAKAEVNSLIYRRKIDSMCQEGLRVGDAGNMGFGVFATAKFLPDQFLCEYAGKLFRTGKAWREQNQQADRIGSCFIFNFVHNSQKYYLDATKDDGSFGRLINHSSHNANCQPKLTIVQGVPRLFFVATKLIKPGDQLVYVYVHEPTASEKEAFNFLSKN